MVRERERERERGYSSLLKWWLLMLFSSSDNHKLYITYESFINMPSRIGHKNTLTEVGSEPPQQVSGYDIKQSDGDVPVMLELLRMLSTPSLPSIRGPLWPRILEPEKVLSMGQIKVNCVIMLNWFDLEFIYLYIYIYIYRERERDRAW